MGVIRVNKSSDYTVMSNYHFKEKNMSLKAKGLLSLMLSLPDNWDYTVAGLATLSSDGTTSVRSALKELEDFHYLIRSRVYENGKIVDWQYNIYELPQTENLVVGIQQLDILTLENKDNKILNEVNTKESNKDLDKNSKELENFDFGGKRKKNTNLYSKCISQINSRNYTEKIKSALIDYLNVRIQMKDKPLYANSWKGLLNKLEREFDEKDRLQVIYQSIERGYASFFPVSKNSFIKSNNQCDKLWEQGVSCRKMTEQQEKEHENWLNEQRAKGIKVDF